MADILKGRLHTILNNPVIFHDYLKHFELFDDIYKALVNPDLSELVIILLKLLRKSKCLTPLVKVVKTEAKSDAFRKKGNQAIMLKKFQLALTHYNKALLYAPQNSRSMILAYSNRSALFFTVKAFTACLKDVETCFALGCPADVMEKLRLRKTRAEMPDCYAVEALFIKSKHTDFSNDFFKLNRCNPMIPCATLDIGVIKESGLPKVVAVNDIKVGTVLAVEEAFVIDILPENSIYSCYYCQNQNLNLKPCDHCVYALFCNDQCKNKCMKEYHDIECQIMEVLQMLSSSRYNVRLALKAVLKMRKIGSSWGELNSASLKMGTERLKNTNINELYDSNYKFSILNYKNERHFLHGAAYNMSIICAAIIHYLGDIPKFFPQARKDKTIAIKGLARLLMNLSLFPKYPSFILTVLSQKQLETHYNEYRNRGLFSFIGKLNYCCSPNVLAVALNKKMALVALRPIKRGNELIITNMDQWKNNQPSKLEIRQKYMYSHYGIICDCVVCNGDCRSISSELTMTQKKMFRKLNINTITANLGPETTPEIYEKLCKALALLSNVPFAFEYIVVYELLRRCLMYLQDCAASNVILDHLQPDEDKDANN